MNTTFRTSRRLRYVVWFLYAILWGVAVFLIYEERNYGILLTLVWTLPFCLNQERYELSDTVIIVRQGGFQWSSNTIPWKAITSVSAVRSGFRIDYAKPDGKKGFYVIRKNYIDNADEMLKLIKEYVYLSGKAEKK